MTRLTLVKEPTAQERFIIALSMRFNIWLQADVKALIAMVREYDATKESASSA